MQPPDPRDNRERRTCRGAGRPGPYRQYHLRRLSAKGHVTQPKRGAWELTAAGRRAALAAAVPALSPLDVSAVLATLPPWHAAMVRLGVGAAIARRTLVAAYPANWPTLIALGRTKTGKTLIGYVICRLLGLDPTAQIRLLSFETAGSVGIRRTQRAGGDFEAKLASLLREPFVVWTCGLGSYLFDASDGTLRSIASAANDTGFRFHDMRHSTASIMAAGGERPEIIQRVLRHAKVSFTLDRYVKVYRDDIRDAA